MHEEGAGLASVQSQLIGVVEAHGSAKLERSRQFPTSGAAPACWPVFRRRRWPSSFFSTLSSAPMGEAHGFDRTSKQGCRCDPKEGCTSECAEGNPAFWTRRIHRRRESSAETEGCTEQTR